jgi:hypothetical protein
MRLINKSKFHSFLLVLVLQGALIGAISLEKSFLVSAYSIASPNPYDAKPLPAPKRWRGLIGEYGPDHKVLIILEKDGQLHALFKGTQPEP